MPSLQKNIFMRIKKNQIQGKKSYHKRNESLWPWYILNEKSYLLEVMYIKAFL